MVCNFSISLQMRETGAKTSHESKAFSEYFVLFLLLTVTELFGLLKIIQKSGQLCPTTVAWMLGSYIFLLLWHTSLSSVHNTLLVYILCLCTMAPLYASCYLMYTAMDKSSSEASVAYIFSFGMSVAMLLYVFELFDFLVVIGTCLFFP